MPFKRISLLLCCALVGCGSSHPANTTSERRRGEHAGEGLVAQFQHVTYPTKVIYLEREHETIERLPAGARAGAEAVMGAYLPTVEAREKEAEQ